MTPIVYIFFNRPEYVIKTFDCIRNVRPRILYLIADGPRHGHNGEKERCEEVRQIVESMIDWDCDIKRNYSTRNMGCRNRIVSGIDWVMSFEESAIILEDDVLVDDSFFEFCDEMLNTYQDNEKIIQVSGYNPTGFCQQNADYFFSRYSSIWGWATWRRAWKLYHDYGQEEWNKIKRRGSFDKHCLSQHEVAIRTRGIDEVFAGKLDTWDALWALARAMHDGLGIIPTSNLVRNIGFGSDSTHTFSRFNKHKHAQISTLNKPYTPPLEVKANEAYDKRYCAREYSYYTRIRTWLWYIWLANKNKNKSKRKP